MFTLNKILMISAVASFLLAASFASQADDPSSAQITVSGTVDAATCEWDTGGGSQQVPFGDVNITTLQAGPVEKTFNLKLKNCPRGVVFVTVHGTESDDVFANTAVGADAAVNVGVTLWNNYIESVIAGAGHSPVTDYRRVKNNGTSRKASVDTTTFTVVLPFKAKLQIAAGKQPKAGNVSVPITMVLTTP